MPVGTLSLPVRELDGSRRGIKEKEDLGFSVQEQKPRVVARLPQPPAEPICCSHGLPVIW